MKKYTSLVLFLLSSFPYDLGAQVDPITIQFVEAQPVWEHLVWDTSFYEIGNQPDVNKYTVVKPHKSYRFGNDLFISNYCTNHRGEVYGYILEKLDIFSGETLWQNYSTYYNNGLQDYYRNLYLRPDGNLEMIGIKRHGPYLDSGFSYWNTGGGKSDYLRKVFNYNNGDLIQTRIGNDSIGQIIPLFMNFYPIEFDSTYLALRQTLFEPGQSQTYGYYFYKLNAEHCLENQLPIASIGYETTDSVSFWSYGQPQFIEKLNDTTLVCLIFQDRSYPEKTKAQLIWINIKDIENITEIRRMNVENYIPGMESSYLFFVFSSEKGNIYFTQHYFNESNNQVSAYLTCISGNGDLVHYIPVCSYDGHVYEAVRLIYSKDNFDYFVGIPSITGRKGMDFLKLERNSDSFEFISSLTSQNFDEEFTRQMEVSKLYDDGIFVIGAYTKKLGAEQNSAVKYYAFNSADLHLELGTSINVNKLESDVNVYPNPTNGQVNFDFSNQFNGQIIISNVFGEKVAIFEIEDKYSHQFHLEGLPNGMYYAVLHDHKSNDNRVYRIILQLNK